MYHVSVLYSFLLLNNALYGYTTFWFSHQLVGLFPLLAITNNIAVNIYV